MLFLALMLAGVASAQPPGQGWRPLIQRATLDGWQKVGSKSPMLWHAEASNAEGVFVNTGRGANLVTVEKFGDIELYLEFQVAPNSNSGVYLNGQYEVQIRDSFGVAEPTFDDCGGIHKRAREGFAGSAPLKNAARPAGDWQTFQIWFRTPRFDAGGNKTANARILRVLHNGILVQRDVDVDGPTVSALSGPEGPANPLMLQGDHGPVSYRNIYVRPLP
jgi:hypothetical protein